MASISRTIMAFGILVYSAALQHKHASNLSASSPPVNANDCERFCSNKKSHTLSLEERCSWPKCTACAECESAQILSASPLSIALTLTPNSEQEHEAMITSTSFSDSSSNNVASNPLANENACEEFCSNEKFRTVLLEEKCSWLSCSGCAECEGALKDVPNASSPSIATTLESNSEQEHEAIITSTSLSDSSAERNNCEMFCSSEQFQSLSVEDKCSWRKCSACDGCEDVSKTNDEQLSELTNPPSDEKSCDMFCTSGLFQSLPLQQRCSWQKCKDCDGCTSDLSESSSEAAFAQSAYCYSFCSSAEYEKLPLGQKCGWTKCMGCDGCTSTLKENIPASNELCRTSFDLCDTWIAAGKSCSTVWKDECPGIDHDSGNNDITLAEGCPYKCAAQTISTTLDPNGLVSETEELVEIRDVCPGECLHTKGKDWVQKCDWKVCKSCKNCQSHTKRLH